jgi:hypothetical protein
VLFRPFAVPFGQFRHGDVVMRQALVPPGAAGALVVPVVESMANSLAEVADAHPALAAKCADLEQQLRTFTAPRADGDEMPF